MSLYLSKWRFDRLPKSRPISEFTFTGRMGEMRNVNLNSSAYYQTSDYYTSRAARLNVDDKKENE